MKIAPISVERIENLAKKYNINPNNSLEQKSKQLFSINFDARENLERHAEEMNPTDYIKARRYLAEIEFVELAKGKIL